MMTLSEAVAQPPLMLRLALQMTPLPLERVEQAARFKNSYGVLAPL